MPEFDPKKVTVIFVLGGPGAGKGTQCARLVNDFGFVHLSAGDLLRAEQQRPDSQYGALIAEHIKEGKIVPQEVTIGLLRNAMKAALDSAGASVSGASKLVPESQREKWSDGKGRFLIDGFPRKMDQALLFDEQVCPNRFVLFLNADEDTMLERLLERGKTSGRTDDNAESIKKRFRTFVETSMPVVSHYREHGQVVEVDSVRPIEEVTQDIRKAVRASFEKLGEQP
ncbi:putative URA6-uridine-monophosphate kinase [Ceraceosorus guamensis]|uniref:Uridylate kinase n=1 Tax=Ceraceosorus guamensis TaxID=1522189 RepID=A0A316VSS2_9BASI|nr:putative URA6-uridine-monophosphate kinase [Ceraceosorus guamensis]PWN40088.1 putative URA6-uridine-monophosphate kinase [Ceraceosorus guamensis]